MNSLFVTVAVLVLVSTCANAGVTFQQQPVAGESDIASYSETTAVVVDGVQGNDKALEGVTPYDYKSMMLRNIVNFQCWRCSSPCSSYMCCNDGYPQCCLYNGRCMCCRF